MTCRGYGGHYILTGAASGILMPERELASNRRLRFEESSMKDATAQTVELESSKVEFLQQMATDHGLPDVGKAIRCLVEYARANPTQQAEIFGESRCRDC